MSNEMISIYMKQVEKIPLLSDSEEKDLLKKAAEGDQVAKDKIVTSNLRYVVKMANKFRNRGVDFEDLVCEGNAALLRAIEKMNPSKNVKFITYANFWIYQYMKAAVYAYGRCVSIPQNRPDQLKNQDLSAVSLDKPFDLSDAEGLSLMDSLCDTMNRTPEEACMLDFYSEDFKEVFSTVLSDREQYVLENHYGLNGCEKIGLRDIAEDLGISREGVRQIEVRALEKLESNPILNEYVVA